MRTYRQLSMHLGGLGGHQQREKRSQSWGPAGQLPTEGAWGAVGRLYEMVRKGRANPFWPPVDPDRRGDTQEVK